jgi:hypothetical protein
VSIGNAHTRKTEEQAMGSGDFGSNGSVHWRIIHTIDETRKEPGFVRGRDPNVPCDNKSDNSLLPDDFKVTLRFKSRGQLDEALSEAQRKLGPETKILVIHVPRRENPPPEPPTKNWEVTVAWKPSAKPPGRRKARQKTGP